jgi:hypothetical protein
MLLDNVFILFHYVEKHWLQSLKCAEKFIYSLNYLRTYQDTTFPYLKNCCTN